eukprot:3353244-Rhodomonas_salina.1
MQDNSVSVLFVPGAKGKAFDCGRASSCCSTQPLLSTAAQYHREVDQYYRVVPRVPRVGCFKFQYHRTTTPRSTTSTAVPQEHHSTTTTCTEGCPVSSTTHCTDSTSQQYDTLYLRCTMRRYRYPSKTTRTFSSRTVRDPGTAACTASVPQHARHQYQLARHQYHTTRTASLLFYCTRRRYAPYLGASTGDTTPAARG